MEMYREKGLSVLLLGLHYWKPIKEVQQFRLKFKTTFSRKKYQEFDYNKECLILISLLLENHLNCAVVVTY